MASAPAHERDVKQLARSGSHCVMSPAAGPDIVLKMASGYHHTCAIKTALDIDLFTAIAEGHNTAALLSERCCASFHGIESLCHYLAAHHLLRKQGVVYELSEEAKQYLDRHSENFCGTLVEYLCLPDMQNAWMQLTSAVQYGGAPQRRERSDHQMAVLQARATTKLRRPLAQRIASLIASSVPIATGEPFRVLNAGAGHGMFGIMLAAQCSEAEVWLCDYAPVLEVARENAAHERQLQRISYLPGSVFSIKPQDSFHVVAAAFFLSTFEPAEALHIASRLYELLLPGGLLVIADDVLDESRSAPPLAVSQNLNLLATTPGGRVYSVSELHGILAKAGFESVTAQGLCGGVTFLARRPELSATYSDTAMQDSATMG